MKTIALLLLFFLAVGVLARSYDRRARIVLGLGIAIVILYMYIVA